MLGGPVSRYPGLTWGQLPAGAGKVPPLSQESLRPPLKVSEAWGPRGSGVRKGGHHLPESLRGRVLTSSYLLLLLLRRVRLFATPMNCSTHASLSFTFSRSLFTLMSLESVMPSSKHLHVMWFLSPYP